MTKTQIKQAGTLVGRCLDITHQGLIRGWKATALTIVSYNDERDQFSVHLNNGDIDTHVNRKALWRAYQEGWIVESDAIAPFINERTGAKART